MANSLKLTDKYFGVYCKILVNPINAFTKQQESDLKALYSEYEIKEIGYSEKSGYKYKYAAFAKDSK